MKILKFGGTSIGSASRMKNVANLIVNQTDIVVVLSALSGTTNSLVEISDYFYKKNIAGALEKVNRLEQLYVVTIDELYSTDKYKEEAGKILKSHFDYIRSFSTLVFTINEEKAVLAQGELISTVMFHLYLDELGKSNVLIPALDYMRIDMNGEPDTVFIAEHLQKCLEKYGRADVILTQGFICRNLNGKIDNLGRGGSDYTASLIGAAIEAKEIQIWTDIDGMHNNDPRYVEGTKPVPSLHFDEAAELAYFGAKILHPTCILPAKLNGIPVRLLNTIEPKAQGTLISNEIKENVVKAIAAKDGITAIKIKSGRMLLAYGFLRKIFEIFESYRTPIDMITTSEVGVSVTIDDTRYLDDIVTNLMKYGMVTVDSDMVIICVVGNMPYEETGFQSKIIHALKDIPIRMISYGGSNYNISFLVKSEDKQRALELLSRELF